MGGNAIDNGDPSLVALAGGDLNAWADSFSNAGFQVRLPARGILQVNATRPGRARLLLSVGVHGDETAPIELMAGLLDELAASPRALQVDLLVVVGNPDAIAAGQRFIDADLNRLFGSARNGVESAREAGRADAIMRASASFLAPAGGPSLHLDLHTAIRGSRFPTFAVVPDAIEAGRRAVLLAWLGQAGIEAAVLNPTSAGTYSAYTAMQHAAASATLELGRVARLGANDLGRFAATRVALAALLRGEEAASGGRMPHLFRVVQEVVKQSAAFRPHFTLDAENFTPFAPGSLIAEDGAMVYRAGAQTEYVVFPNPEVRVGLRAGLMVVCADQSVAVTPPAVPRATSY